MSISMKPNGFAGGLSVRESEVLSLVAEGYTGEEIAGKLCVARITVDKHRTSIIRKLHARNTNHALVIAMRQGIIK